MMKEEEEAVTSKNNDDNDDATNIYSYSDSDNNLIRDDGYNNLNQISHVWGTWEELLLTCAVKRHGYKDWVSVAKEVSSRSSINASAVNCRLKYRDLKRRFRDSVDVYGGGGGEVNREAVNTEEEEDGVGEITWLEELRSLRMAELRREVQRCDESILSLQLKVKKLEEEKSQEEDNKPDLNDDGDDDGSKAVRSGSDETEPVWLNRDTTESDHRSINESNSTASVADHDRLGVDKTVQANENSINPDPYLKTAATAEMSYSGELGRGKRRARNYKSGDDNIIRGGSGGDIKSHGVKLQPLIEIIKMIRSHPCGSVFEHRLRSQETEDYKRVIKQHIDIKTIEKKIEKGSYVSSRLCFYRDVKLLFTNAIVFFPSSSSESVAAQELLTLVSNEIKKQTGESCHSVIKIEAKSSFTRKKASAPLPLVVCKKKTSVSKKMPPSSSFKQKYKENTMTTTTTTHSSASARSSRRTSNVVAKDTKMGRAKSSNKKQDSSDDEEEKGETSKTEEEDKKKKTVSKKKSVAEFLKRIKTNSPQKEQETATTSKGQKKKSDVKDKSKTNPRELRSNRAGKNKFDDVENSSEKKSSSKRKQLKKEEEEEGEEEEEEEEEEEKEESVYVVTTRKRGRETRKDNKSQQQQQPKKRSRR